MTRVVSFSLKRMFRFSPLLIILLVNFIDFQYVLQKFLKIADINQTRTNDYFLEHYF